MPPSERRVYRVSLFSFGLLNFNLKLIFVRAWKIGAVAIAQVFAKLGLNSAGFLPLAVLRFFSAVRTTFALQCEWGTWQTMRMDLSVKVAIHAD